MPSIDDKKKNAVPTTDNYGDINFHLLNYIQMAARAYQHDETKRVVSTGSYVETQDNLTDNAQENLRRRLDEIHRENPERFRRSASVAGFGGLRTFNTPLGVLKERGFAVFHKPYPGWMKTRVRSIAIETEPKWVLAAYGSDAQPFTDFDPSRFIDVDEKEFLRPPKSRPRPRESEPKTDSTSAYNDYYSDADNESAKHEKERRKRTER
jgi:hypothetical protein